MDFAALLLFLSALAANNNKAWFDAHRPVYEALRREFTDFVAEVIDGVVEFDPSVAVVDAKDALFRINRDVRFSSDKRPYNTTFSAAICGSGRKSNLPLYYLHIADPGVFLVAGGVYSPTPEQLALIRRHVAEHPERLAAVLDAPGFSQIFTLSGERLKRPPQGFDEQTPYIDIIKQKRFAALRELPDW
jgi:uncharacterized protein (TIGR02453 family)